MEVNRAYLYSSRSYLKWDIAMYFMDLFEDVAMNRGMVWEFIDGNYGYSNGSIMVTFS